MIPRLFVDQPLAEGGTLGLGRDQTHYLVQVLRRREGDPLLLFNGRDGEWAASVSSLARNAATVRLEARQRPQAEEPGPVLYLAPPKRPRLEWLVEKAVELGVARIQPVLTERTVVKLANPERLRSQMVEAAEQCRRLTVPALEEPLPLHAALQALPAGARMLMADEAGGGTTLDRALAQPGSDHLLVGPEGGFSPEERAWLHRQPAVLPVTLGRLVLRTETAALALLACWCCRR